MSEDFDKAVNKAILILNNLAKDVSSMTLYDMEQAFIYSGLLEWHFWNDAYRMQILKSLSPPNIGFLQNKNFELKKSLPNTLY